MRKRVIPILTAFLVCIFLLGGCAQKVSEVGEWKLSFFGEGGMNYSVGDEYHGDAVTESFYFCTFDGTFYKVYNNGQTVMEGKYSAKNSGTDSILLILNDGGEDLLWNCGVQTDVQGKSSVGITAELDGRVVRFIPA